MYKKELFGEEFQDLAYNHISSLNLKIQSNQAVFMAGLILFIVGMLASSAGVFFIGILLAIIGFLWKESYYELRAAGLETPWRISASNSLSAKELIRTIRDYLTVNSVDAKGELNLTVNLSNTNQKHKFCANCGAKIKGKFCSKCGEHV